MGDTETLNYEPVKYTSRQVSELLSIATSTLRTWCLDLEHAGYIFDREKRDSEGNPVGNRVFYERDITALRTMKKLLEEGHPKDYAIHKITRQFNKMTNHVIASSMQEADESNALSKRHDGFPDEIKQQLFAEFRNIVREEITAAQQVQLLLPGHSQLEKRFEDFTERIEDVMTQFKRQQEEVASALDTIITETRAAKHKRKKFLGLF